MGIADDILDQIAKDIVEEIQHQIVTEDLVHTRQLFESWEIQKTGENERTIGSPLIYARIMDEGRLPGKMPPVDALFPWVSDKIGATSSKEARSIAWAVAKKIEREGIEPRHYIRSALFRMEKESD